MTTGCIHEAKTHLSRLIELALAREAQVIARAGKPLVKRVRRLSRLRQQARIAPRGRGVYAQVPLHHIALG